MPRRAGCRRGGARRDAAAPLAALRFHARPCAAVLRGHPPRRAGAGPGLPRVPGLDARLLTRRSCWPSWRACLPAGLQGRPARHEQVRPRHPGDPRGRCIEGHPDLPRRVPAGLDGAGRGRRAGRLRDLHSATDHRPVECGEGRRSEEGDGGAGAHHAAERCGVRRRRADRRGARAHEGRHVPGRRARQRHRAPADEAPNAREMDALHAAVQQAGLSKR